MDTVINIRTKKKVRDDAKKVFKKMGLTTSTAINMFLHRVAAEQCLPFQPAAPRTKNISVEEKEILETKKVTEKKSKNFFQLWK